MDNLATKLTPEAEQLQQETTGLLTQARQFKVANAEQFQQAGTELIRIKGVRKKIDEMFDPGIKKAHETHKEFVALKKTFTDPCDQTEMLIKRELSVYNEQQRRIAAEQEAKLRAIAEEQARKERERLLAQAVKADEKGQSEKAETLLDQAETVITLVPIVTPQVEKVQGISSRKVWKARIVNEQLVPAYHNGVEIRKIQQGQLDRIAQMTAGNTQIQGIEFYPDEIISARAM